MTVGQGQIFASGISILLKGPNDQLAVSDSAGPVKYLHFVDAGGNTIVPTYEPDGLDAGGGKVAGARYVIIGAAEIAALTARVTALEAQLATVSEDPDPDTIAKRDTSGRLRATAFVGGELKSTTDATDPAISVSASGGFPQVGFLGATPVNVRSVDVLAADPDKLNDIVTGLIQLGLFQAV